jgi:PKD repeat protein
MKKHATVSALLVLAACSDVTTTPTLTVPARLEPAMARNSLAGPIPNKYIVRFRDDEVDPSGRAHSIERSHGGKVEHVYTMALKGASMTIPDVAVQALRADPNVLAVEQDQTVHATVTQSNPTWGLDRIDQRNRPYSASYSYAVSGSGVTVYLLDTGINFSHVEYSSRASTGIDEVTAGGNASDCDGHGSHVAGTIGGNTFGVAKSVSLVSVRVLDCSGSGTVAGVIAGVDWVAQHAVKPAVANMSLGGGFSSALNQSVQNAVAAGVTFVVAAGNSSGNACNESPSSAATAITVAASDSLDRFASFSNFGSCVDIIAPGVNVLSSYIGSSTATAIGSGTSMASPHVAGAAALYLQTNPSATPGQVAAALTGGATPNLVTLIPAATANKLLYMGFIGAAVNQAPVARFTWSCTGLITNQCALDGTLSSDDVGIVTWGWNWGNGKSETKTVPTAKNTWSAPGVYTVTLTVTDGGGLTATQTQQVTVGSAPPSNQSPTANITLPTAPANFVQGTSISFAGTGNDPEDGTLSGASLVWTSNIDGAIGTGVGFSKSNLSVGSHTITLTATDSKGATGTATRTVTITPPNQAPTANITSPSVPASYVQGAAVSFAGTGTDPEDGPLSGASLTWTSSIDGVIGAGTSFTTSSLSVGTHTITLTATDSKGATGTATRSVMVTPQNQAPTASITTPANNATNVVQGTSVSFVGAGSDPEDGTLAGGALVWTSNLDGQIGTGGSFSTSSLSVGQHTITLTVTDSKGATGTATRTVTISTTQPTNQPPVASFTVNCAQATVHQCLFDATGSTDDVAIVTWKWNWGNGRPVETKIAPTAKNTFATGGTYQVTLTVTDGGGLTHTITKSVVVP